MPGLGSTLLSGFLIALVVIAFCQLQPSVIKWVFAASNGSAAAWGTGFIAASTTFATRAIRQQVELDRQTGDGQRDLSRLCQGLHEQGASLCCGGSGSAYSVGRLFAALILGNCRREREGSHLAQRFSRTAIHEAARRAIGG